MKKKWIDIIIMVLQIIRDQLPEQQEPAAACPPAQPAAAAKPRQATKK